MGHDTVEHLTTSSTVLGPTQRLTGDNGDRTVRSLKPYSSLRLHGVT